ncbi:MAG: peptidoglycan DD-metalloendopeptidase family protein [Sphingorhabdus sp.]
MRFFITLFLLAAIPVGLATTLLAQSGSEQQQALREAKARAAKAEERSERLRQEAANAGGAADRLLAQRAVLSAEIDAARAQISAAQARIAIISQRQQTQLATLGRESEPLLRLNAALQQLTSRPAIFLLAQPGSRKDYIHLRAVMDSVRPEISRRTAALRQQIAIQKDLRSQERLALASLRTASSDLADRRASLVSLENAQRGKAGNLTAGAAAEFERAIAQGERARDIVEEIGIARLTGENAAALAALDGPALRGGSGQTRNNNGAYVLPEATNVVFGYNELNQTGYRERGVRLALPAQADVAAPAGGRVAFAGIYRSYGKIVIIEHGGGWTSLITNLGELSVEEGQQVAQGETLGQAKADDSEVTFELRRKGRVMDIAALLM